MSRKKLSTRPSAGERLRGQVRQMVTESGRSQASVARELGITPKHLCQMLTGRAVLTVEWAEKIAAVCGHRLVIAVVPVAR